MSQTEVLRFQEYLKGHPDLLPEIGKGRMSHALAIAADQGFKLTLVDVRAFVKAKAGAKGRTLNDEQLDKVAGGAGYCFDSEHCCFSKDPKPL
ncbi:MAG: hypothetical protein EPO67_22945 [Reyranella sp.]|nr:MAG: hypothetical protein EPO67_22945 [Reyranella sp.]